MSKFDSLVLYFCVYTLSAGLLVLSRKQKGKRIDLWFILALVGPVLLAALRDNVGTDYQNYVWMYKSQSQLTFSQWFEYTGKFVDGTPLGMWMISRIAGYFDSVEVYFGLLSLFMLAPVFLFIKDELPKDTCFLNAIFFLTGTFTTGFNMVKQGIAIAFIIYGLRYVFERKPLKYLFFVIIAYCFHPSAIIAVFIYMFQENKGSLFSGKRIFLVLLSVVFVLSITSILERLGGRFAGYAEGPDVEFNNRTFYLNMFWCAVFFLFRKKFFESDERSDALILLFLVGLIMSFSGFFSPYIKRIARYYTLSKSMLFAQFPTLFPQNEKIVFKLIMFAYALLMFTISFYILEQADIIPYNFITRSGI